MSAVQEALKPAEKRVSRLAGWPSCPLPPGLPVSRAVYIAAVVGVDLGLIGWQLARLGTPQARDLILFAVLLTAAVICIEAMRRLGRPAGVSRDLLSAWWLPIALLLPPVYALLAPLILGCVLGLRAQPVPVLRRMFSSAALGLAGAAASGTFHRFVRDAVVVTLKGSNAWLTRPSVVLIAVACGVLFAVVNGCIIAVAPRRAGPGAPLASRFWDRESLLLDLTETCVGVLVAITCTLSFFLLLLALLPVIMLQRSMMHQQLTAAARTDSKTGLLNATAWQREADAEVSRALRSATPLALLLIDVDYFKRVNDNHGHLIGDEVLRGLAEELSRQVRDSDVVGRFGGEEFTILLPGTDAAGACRIADRLRHSASRLVVPAAAARIQVTVSIGVAALGQHGNDLFELLAAADLALYRAKDAGRNQVRLFVPGQEPAGNEAAFAPAEVLQEEDQPTDACP
jgi:diguanylate cyclase (GGDEF)-like protein